MKRALTLLLAVLLMFSLVACGASDTPPEADTPPAAADTPDEGGGGAAAPDAGEDTLKILATVRMNTDQGDRAQFIFDRLVEETNASGGILGRTVEVEYLDAGLDQQAYINCIQRAVNTDGVDVIMGSFTGEYCIAASDYIKEAKIPTINLSINQIQLDMNEYYFITRAVTTGVNGAWAQSALDAGMKNPVVVCQNTDTGVASTEQMQEIFEANGATFADVIYYDQKNITDYAPITLQAMNVSGADGLILNMTSSMDDGPSTLSTLHMYEYENPVSLCASMMSNVLSEVVGGEAVDGMFGVAEYSPELDTPGNQEFLAKLDEWGFDFTLDWTSAAFYDVFKVICEAATVSGDTTKESIYEGLKSIDNLEGAMTTYSSHDIQSFANFVYAAEFDSDGNIVLGDPVEVIHPAQ